MSVPILLLLSGGIDSTTLLNFYKSRHVTPICIHFQYNQDSNLSEKKAVKKITEYYNVPLQIIPLNIPQNKRKNELIGRNSIFILAASALGYDPAIITIGIHSGTEYYDCSDSFLKDIQNLLDGYFMGSVQVVAPFINETKKSIINYCKENKIPIELTYSCLRKNSPPCGKCPSCLDRKEFL